MQKKFIDTKEVKINFTNRFKYIQFMNLFFNFLFQKFNIKKKYTYVLIIFIFFSSKLHNVNSRSIDLLFMTTVVHIEPIIGIDITNSSEMPHRIDDGAFLVFTPGIGFIYDTREDDSKKGWSFVYGGHFNLNCYGTETFGAGIGGRHKFLITQKFNINISAMMELLVMTRKFLPTYAWKENKFSHELANLMMHDIPNTDHKIIFPTPIFDINFAYEVKKGYSVNFNLMWSGVAVGVFFGITLPMGSFVDILKNSNPPKRRKIIKSKIDYTNQ